MERNAKRLCDRKIFNHTFSFETSIVETKKKQNGSGVDISSCGLGMETGHALHEGSVLMFYLPMLELEVTVPVYAQVICQNLRTTTSEWECSFWPKYGGDRA